MHFKYVSFFVVAPMVRVENQLELAYVTQRNISLHCTSESFPPAIHYWKFSNGSAISGGNLPNKLMFPTRSVFMCFNMDNLMIRFN